jgi:hypothetical protein
MVNETRFSRLAPGNYDAVLMAAIFDQSICQQRETGRADSRFRDVQTYVVTDEFFLDRFRKRGFPNHEKTLHAGHALIASVAPVGFLRSLRCR